MLKTIMANPLIRSTTSPAACSYKQDGNLFLKQYTSINLEFLKLEVPFNKIMSKMAKYG